MALIKTTKRAIEKAWPERKGLLWKFLSLTLVLGVLLTLQPLTAIGQTSAPGFELTGKLERFPADARALLGADYVPQPQGNTDPNVTFTLGVNGTMIMIPEARQIWQVYLAPLGAQRSRVTIRDLDTLKIIHTMQFEFAPLREASSSDQSGGWMHAIDREGLRLFLVASNQQNAFEINLRTFEVKTRRLLGTISFGHGVGGVTFDNLTNELLLLYSGPGSSSVANSDVFVYRVDLAAPANTPADLAKVSRINSCNGPVTSTEGTPTLQWEILVTEKYLYVPCSRAGHIGTVVRMARPTVQNPIPREDYVAGPVYAEAVLADHQGGRLFMVTISKELWVFEAETMSFIGVVAAAPDGTQGFGEPTGWGLDYQTGQFLFQAPQLGLGVVEGRFFPVPQAVRFPRYERGKERIFIDNPTRRVFILEGSSLPINRNDPNNKAYEYRIYRTGPAPIPPPPPDPDRNTLDTEEKAGVTESRFFASGGGYGARVIWAKGWGAVIPVPVLGQQAPTSAIGNATAGRGGFIDREFSFGRVFRAEYDTGSTSASAIAAGVDESSRQEFNWNRQAAACSSSEGGKDEKGVGKPDDLGPSTVVCPLPGGRLRAFAETRLPATGSFPAELQGNLTVGKAWTETLITKLNRGILSESVAVAQDINIGGVIHIGEIRSNATSFSNGRPSRKDMSTHTVTFRGVRIGEDLLCSNCTDTQAVVDALNVAGGPLRAQFRTGTHENIGIDLALKRGTPKGALTAVQKSEARRTQDRVLVADNTTDVPGLEMITYNDNIVYGRARQIYQFAGVSTVANYNIVALPTGDGFIDEAPSSIGDDFSGDVPALSLTDGSSSGSSDGGGLGGIIQRAVEAIGRGLRLFLSNPRQFMLLTTAWGLFGLAPYLARRRRLLDLARAA